MNGQTTTLAVMLVVLVPGIAWAVLWSTQPGRVGKYQARRSAGRQAAFVRNVEAMNKSIQKMGPAFQQMGAATKKAAEAMRPIGELLKKEEGKHRG